MALWFGEALIVTRQPSSSPLQPKLLLYSVDKKDQDPVPIPRRDGWLPKLQSGPAWPAGVSAPQVADAFLPMSRPPRCPAVIP